MTQEFNFINDILSLEKGEVYVAAKCFTSIDSLSGGKLKVRFEFNRDYAELMEENREMLVLLCKRCLPYAGYLESLKKDENVGFMEFHFYITENEQENEEGLGTGVRIRTGVYFEIQNQEFYQTSLPSMISDFLEVTSQEVNEIYERTLSENQAVNSSLFLN